MIQFFAPNTRLPSTSVTASRPMAAAAAIHRSRLTRFRSRRHRPAATNSPSPSTMAANCLTSDPGADDAVTARERVERKNAMVSISKPTHRVARSTP